MSTQDNAAKLQQLAHRYPNNLKVLRSEEEIKKLLDFDAVMKGGEAGVNTFKNDDPALPEFITKQLSLGKDVSVSAGGKYSLLVIVGNGLFNKRSTKHEEETNGLIRGKEDFSNRSVAGCMAMLDKEYRKAAGIFQELIADYPYEAASYIRYCEMLFNNNSLTDEQIPLLNRAEGLINSRKSEYPMDKWNGLRDLYCWRGFAFYYANKAGGTKDFYIKAKDEMEKSLGLDPSYGSALKLKALLNEDPPKGGGGCFIATAVYGCTYAKEVTVLREFRDECLLKYKLGNAFVKMYYRLSPPIANQISKRKYAKILTKTLVIVPLLYVVNKYKRAER